MITALFVQEKSIYKSLGIDCYDYNRNALNFPLSNPVIAHPPCRAWSRLKAFAKPLEGEKELGLWAVQVIRYCGGVLEHPRSTGLISEMALPIDGKKDKFGGFCLCVDQKWWGHKATKKTVLYICGCELRDIPAMPLNFDCTTHRVGGIKKKSKTGMYRFHNKALKELSKSQAEATPVAFATWLIQIAELCKPNYTNPKPDYLDLFKRATTPSN